MKPPTEHILLQSWVRTPKNVRAEFTTLLQELAEVRDGTLPYATFLAEFPAIQIHLRFWLTEGTLCDNPSTAETCRHLRALDATLWNSVTVPGVDPINHATERVLSHPVIRRRTSHGTQADHGSLFVQRMLTVAENCRLLHRPVFAFVRCALLAYLVRASLPHPSSRPFLIIKTAVPLPAEHTRLDVFSIAVTGS